MCFGILINTGGVRCKTTRIFIKNIYILFSGFSELVNIVCTMFAVSVYRSGSAYLYSCVYIYCYYRSAHTINLSVLRRESRVINHTNVHRCTLVHVPRNYFSALAQHRNIVTALRAFKIHGTRLFHPCL